MLNCWNNKSFPKHLNIKCMFLTSVNGSHIHVRGDVFLFQLLVDAYINWSCEKITKNLWHIPADSLAQLLESMHNYYKSSWAKLIA